jgi:hypothetical protein
MGFLDSHGLPSILLGLIADLYFTLAFLNVKMERTDWIESWKNIGKGFKDIVNKRCQE